MQAEKQPTRTLSATLVPLLRRSNLGMQYSASVLIVTWIALRQLSRGHALATTPLLADLQSRALTYCGHPDGLVRTLAQGVTADLFKRFAAPARKGSGGSGEDGGSAGDEGGEGARLRKPHLEATYAYMQECRKITKMLKRQQRMLEGFATTVRCSCYLQRSLCPPAVRFQTLQRFDLGRTLTTPRRMPHAVRLVPRRGQRSRRCWVSCLR